ncbi:hypothetical protein M1N58_01165 [Dehalococcoidales bacterium]|nr:hypothetical protein [Dehalococcoidales bacterium]
MGKRKWLRLNTVNNYEGADLVGKSLAEVREQYKSDFDIPDKAQAKVNGKPVKQKLEAETILNDDDKLVFAEKSKKGLVLTAALVLALTLSSGGFAYTYTTAGVTIDAEALEDFATVKLAQDQPNWNAILDTLGEKEVEKSEDITTTIGPVPIGLQGEVPAGNLFEVTPHPAYTGDLMVKVYLTNSGDLIKAYRYLNMKLRLEGSVEWPGYRLLTLQNGKVAFHLEAPHNPPYTLSVIGGAYSLVSPDPNQWAAEWTITPEFYCEVTQR